MPIVRIKAPPFMQDDKGVCKMLALWTPIELSDHVGGTDMTWDEHHRILARINGGGRHTRQSPLLSGSNISKIKE